MQNHPAHQEPRRVLGSFFAPKSQNTPTWEQRKLGELGKARSGIGFPDAEQGGKEGVPFYKVSDMNKAENEHEMVISNNYVTTEQITRRGWKPIDNVPAIFFCESWGCRTAKSQAFMPIPIPFG